MDERIRQELKTARMFWFWVVLLGPVAMTAVLAGVEGFPIPWSSIARLYASVLIHFIIYTSVSFACLLWMRARAVHVSWLVAGTNYVILAGLCSLMAMAILVPLGLKPFSHWPMHLLRSLVIGIAVMPVFLLLERLYRFAVMTGLDVKRQELEREREQRKALEAQWLSLESRVRPHFLFNTLSSIRELMHRSVPDADLMIQRFSGLIRFSLDSGRNAVVPFEEELQTVAGYLEIEKMRLGSRLRWEMSSEPECRPLLVPSLSVLTLVENSVKHVAAKRRSGGSIAVSAAMQNGSIRIDVKDDGPGFDEADIIAGHGLDLLLQRLGNLYAGNASLILNPATEGAAGVTLLIPAPLGNGNANGHTALLSRR